MLKIINDTSDNYSLSNAAIRAVCLHGTAGSWRSALSWLKNPQVNNPNAAVSANYLVTKSGAVYQLVDWQAGRRAWANGIVENYDKSIKWLVEAVEGKVNPNHLTVSIEHEATLQEMLDHASMTDAAFNASIELTAFILKTAGLKASHETIIGHNQISGKQKYNCPGVIFPPAYTEVLIDRHKELA